MSYTEPITALVLVVLSLSYTVYIIRKKRSGKELKDFEKTWYKAARTRAIVLSPILIFFIIIFLILTYLGYW